MVTLKIGVPIGIPLRGSVLKLRGIARKLKSTCVWNPIYNWTEGTDN